MWIVFYSLVLMKPACLLPNFCFYCFDLLWMERLFCVFINAQERTIESTWGMEMSILYNFCKELWGTHTGQESYSNTWQDSLLSICLAAFPLTGNLHRRRPVCRQLRRRRNPRPRLRPLHRTLTDDRRHPPHRQSGVLNKESWNKSMIVKKTDF